MKPVKISTNHRIAAGLLGGLTLLMAWLQLNDPDPALWVAMYCFLGLNSVLGAAWGVVRSAALAGLVLAAGWALWLVPGVVELFAEHPAGDLFTGMSPDRPYVEQARECLGLLIGALTMVQLLVAARRPAPSADAQA